MERRSFVKYTAAAGASLMLHPFTSIAAGSDNKLKLALVGTGVRGTGLWGKQIVSQFKDVCEFVGLCDINPGRLAYCKEYVGVSWPTFVNVDEMLKQIKADYVIVTTDDATHDEIIIKALNAGFNVITEKPMTTD